MSAQLRDILPLHPVDESVDESVDDPSAEVRFGRLVAYLGGQRAIVDTHSPSGPLMARCLGTIDRDELARGATRGARVRLAFENGDPDRPLVLELVREDLSPGDANPGAGVPASGLHSVTALDVRADGVEKRLLVEAADELVFRCGLASITLLRDGRIVIKGANVETRASGTNRIRGAQVRIN